MSRTRNFLTECWRVRWMLAFSLAIVATRSYGLLPEDSATLKTLYRPALGAMGFVVAHIAWSQVFTYIDMRELLSASRNNLPGATTFSAVCIARGVIYAAFVHGAITAV